MKNPVYEQIQARKVKARLRMLQHAQRISGNVSQTCRFFGVSRALFYIWKERYEKHGVAGLRDLPRRPHKIRFRIPPEIVSLILRIREERRYGAVRVSLYLQRHYHAYVSPTTILKIFHRHHVGPVSLKKYRPGPKPPDAPLQVPGRSVQLDVRGPGSGTAELRSVAAGWKTATSGARTHGGRTVHAELSASGGQCSGRIRDREEQREPSVRGGQ